MNYSQIDELVAPFYLHMQQQGIPLDEGVLKASILSFQSDVDFYLGDLESKLGFRPDFSSASFSKVALAVGADLPCTPTGRPCTAKAVMDNFADHYPELQLLSRARNSNRIVSKLVSLQKNLRQGRVYPQYVFTKGLSRIHSAGVNPMSFSLPEKLAVSRKDHFVLVADYKRLEPQVLAVLSGDPILQRDLKEDPYLALACEVFKDPFPEFFQRKLAKTAFLALIYGASQVGLSKMMGIPVLDAIKIHNTWHSRYRIASQYMEVLKQRGRDRGMALSYFGRPHPLKDSDQFKNDRLSVNSVIQNTAADLAKIGFANLYHDSPLCTWGVQFLTTVHDAVVLLVPNHVVKKDLEQILHTHMEIKKPDFSLSVSLSVGNSWGEVQSI